jgi:hypothetical protein
MLVAAVAVAIGLVGRLVVAARWRWVDWQEDVRDSYRWHLRSALARMAGCGLSPHVIIALAIKQATERQGRSALGLRSIWGSANSP